MSIMLIMIINIMQFTKIRSAQIGASAFPPPVMLFDPKLKKERIEIP